MMLRGKIVLAVAASAAIVTVLHKTGQLDKMIPKPAAMKSAVPTSQGNLPEYTQTAPTTQGNVNVTLPGSEPASTSEKPRIKMLVLPWNAQMGLALANGGPTTTKGSLMEREGINLVIERQDDYSKMQAALVTCATELSKGRKQCSNGVNFVVIMGDGGPAFFAGLNPTLEKLGPEFRARVVFMTGRSFGEDKFMTPAEWKDNPASAKGGLVAGVLKDGDWNIAMLWAILNGICNNPDTTTYNPECLNWVGTDSFGAAGEKFVQGACEDRPVVKNDRKTGETKHICVQAVVTWTPGDVTVAKQKGGLVTALSTKENGNQMAATVIGIDKWMNANAASVDGIIAATLEAGQMVQSSDAALDRAAAISAKIYKEETGAYWKKYYLGKVEKDAQGISIRLGGSLVATMADNVTYFGLGEGAESKYKEVYDFFGKIDVQQYPKDVPSYPPYNDVVNTAFLARVAAKTTNQGKAYTPEFSDAPAEGATIGKQSVHIQFETGKATISAKSKADLDALLQQLTSSDNTAVEVHGHTDNVGSSTKNKTLSEARAFAVKEFLDKRGGFPTNRIRASGHGDTSPVAPNGTAAGRAQNRRVDIVLKENE